jgi:DNA repair protein RadD
MTQYVLRPKQLEAADACVDFFLNGKPGKNGIAIEPTAFGKSLLLAEIARRLDAPFLVFQPGIEILKQNKAKIESYGMTPAVYSASAGSKQIGHVTLATIGSAVKHPELFDDFPYIAIDEAHGVNAKEGMYRDFLTALGKRKLLGLTATPWRLAHNSYGAEARFLTRTKPKIFHEVVHFTQISEMVEAGHWTKIEYKSVKGFDRSKVAVNSTGEEFDKGSLQRHLFEIGAKEKLVEVVERALKAGRRNALAFTQFVPESAHLVDELTRMGIKAALVTGETPKGEREAIADEFKSGVITVVANAKVWILGFDHPKLECVIDNAATMSLMRFYQKFGRGVRVDPEGEKENFWYVDMVQSLEAFGKPEDLTLYCEGDTGWAYWGKPGGGEEIQLTNKYFGPAGGMKCQKCGAPVQYYHHDLLKTPAPLVWPTNGLKPNIAIVKVEDKTYYRLYSEKRPRLDSEPEPTHVSHWAVCEKGR